MNLMLKSPLLILCMLLSLGSSAQGITCRLKGTVTGRESKELLLVPETEDARFAGVSIPIVNHRFEYVLQAPFIMQYQLIFTDELEKGAWRAIRFFPENGEVEFTLHSTEDYEKNVISGGDLNRKKARFDHLQDSLFTPLTLPWSRRLDSLRDAGGYYSDKAKALNHRISVTHHDSILLVLYSERTRLQEEGEWYSPEAARLMAGWDSVDRVRKYWRNDYIGSNIDLFSCSLIFSSLNQYAYDKNAADITFVNDIFPGFRKKFPVHPYTVRVGEMLNAINKLKVGNRFIDFEAPALDGKTVRLSDSIRGKVAVIDLWASWCGPCRALSKSMIPVYGKYRDKGFTIVGVACEYRNTDAMKAAIKHDRYPWLNLVELDNRGGIWSKYNIAGSGGSTFLVDRNGIIVAIHPMAGELDTLVGELCK